MEGIFEHLTKEMWDRTYLHFLPRIKKIQASKELQKISAEYEENFYKLLDSAGTTEYHKYKAIENRLNTKDIHTRDRLGVYVHGSSSDRGRIHRAKYEG